MVEKMLEVCIIRPSQSTYYASAMMVHKKEGSWNMCPNYRELNKITIEDKLTISVIGELVDELYGAMYFRKLDLHLGYHHIRLKEEDIAKIVSITHEGDYGFFLMPFGLRNELSTFQSLMNSIFKPILRNFILVFFDDILIYSKSWEEHGTHIKVKTYHDSHKYFLEHIFSLEEKQKWVTKMLGYDF